MLTRKQRARRAKFSRAMSIARDAALAAFAVAAETRLSMSNEEFERREWAADYAYTLARRAADAVDRLPPHPRYPYSAHSALYRTMANGRWEPVRVER